MSQALEEPLEQALERAIRDVPGVTAVFRAGSPLGKVIEASGELLRGERRPGSLVKVSRTDDVVVAIEVELGVSSEASSVDTLERVYAAVLVLLSTQGLEPGLIRLTVVHISGEGAGL
ncbi:hypothetical protein FB468_2938 [Leucobacter komagatae]|uniref:Asp23/Gls24 family envelope stress response protein n=1 Tax=Leucobacter komagatae TaxID=55969 RepID=A0A542Y9Z2_9MICO|nr:hypothetical protein [Leucobacter komagatae]TQL44867.1 hypothetical protein FB468_2938 [Leucobacter komagatae]